MPREGSGGGDSGLGGGPQTCGGDRQRPSRSCEQPLALTDIGLRHLECQVDDAGTAGERLLDRRGVAGREDDGDVRILVVAQLVERIQDVCEAGTVGIVCGVAGVDQVHVLEHDDRGGELPSGRQHLTDEARRTVLTPGGPVHAVRVRGVHVRGVRGRVSCAQAAQERARQDERGGLR